MVSLILCFNDKSKQDDQCWDTNVQRTVVIGDVKHAVLGKLPHSANHEAGVP